MLDMRSDCRIIIVLYDILYSIINLSHIKLQITQKLILFFTTSVHFYCRKTPFQFSNY